VQPALLEQRGMQRVQVERNCFQSKARCMASLEQLPLPGKRHFKGFKFADCDAKSSIPISHLHPPLAPGFHAVAVGREVEFIRNAIRVLAHPRRPQRALVGLSIDADRATRSA
jgi:hypothetical protein